MAEDNSNQKRIDDNSGRVDDTSELSVQVIQARLQEELARLARELEGCQEEVKQNAEARRLYDESVQRRIEHAPLMERVASAAGHTEENVPILEKGLFVARQVQAAIKVMDDAGIPPARTFAERAKWVVDEYRRFRPRTKPLTPPGEAQ